VEEALKILSEGGEKYKEEYLNVEAADRVLQRFGMPSYMPRSVLCLFLCLIHSSQFDFSSFGWFFSLGIPTYRYGHEPSNRFATFHAKYFSNAIREDILLGICTGGIIFTRGGPGTRQEIFQAACHNHYTIDHFVRPMVIFLILFHSLKKRSIIFEKI
jgi:hypothetical protein